MNNDVEQHADVYRVVWATRHRKEFPKGHKFHDEAGNRTVYVPRRVLADKRRLR
jgi:hypothetical protein